MVVYLDLTEKTIDCFNECARKFLFQGSYAKFVDENQKFIRTLSENLKKVKFPVGETISDMVSQNCKFYIDYLIKWNPREPRGVVPGTAFLERYTPKLVNDLKRAISIRNWDKFYWEYYPTADFIINEARKQGVLDFQIQKGSGSYESFHERDFVVTSMQRNTDDGIRDHHNTPVETKNSKEMILKVEENPKSHQSGNNHSIHYSGNDGQTIICIEDPRASPTKHDNVRKTLIPSQRAHIDNRHTTSPLCSDHSTNGLHGSKKSDYLNRSENSPGIPLRNIPISEQPPVDQLPKSSHQRTSSTPYVYVSKTPLQLKVLFFFRKSPPLQNSSLHDRYKDPTLNSTHRNQHVHNTTKTTRTSQIHRPAQVPLPNVPKQNPQGRYSTPTRILYSEHTMIPSEHKPGFSADDALQNREFQGRSQEFIFSRTSAYKDISSSNAPHNQHVHDTTITNRTSHSGRNAREPVQNVTKQNPQERCSGQSPFNTFGQDSQHTMIQSEYKPGFSAADALRSMEPEMTLNGTLESLSPAYNANQAILNYQKDMHLATLISQNTPPIYESLNNSSSSREISLCRDSPMLDNLTFDIELAKQNLRNAQELEAKREERKKKQKEFDEELKTLKEESKQRFQMLLKCIMLKRRFEEQEQHWMDWIAGCRHSIASFLNRWYDFYDDVEKSHRGFRRPEIVDLYELQRDTGHFVNSIMVTFNVMECDFEHMKRIESAHPDTLFVKVLMKCIADIAHELIRIYNFTQSLGTDQSKFLELQSMMARVNPNKILSTDQLRSICRTANPSDYQYVSFPDLDRNLYFREL
ncbi:Protein CBG18525 [Caenorhabditis briggsae]|uniref:Protein CBG18525 n=1 Tax=Caenorhabditis briggsae TaxID=6238 RepID=A8XTI0_CAEBR|nr:Protein CBG18525 [Caenorhabditis briggsae]CAP35957.2 Protein CBG18525 [Caenorhabditis briggsae]